VTIIAAAYDATTKMGWMAADSQSTDSTGSMRRTPPKIRTIPRADGSHYLLGASGDTFLLRGIDLSTGSDRPVGAWLWKLVELVRAQAQRHGHSGMERDGTKLYDLQLIAMSAEGGIWASNAAADARPVLCDGGVCIEAVGAGRDYALGAMHARLVPSVFPEQSLSLRRAVEYGVGAAVALNAYCGGPVQTCSTSPIEE
jgi:ATP-dependent protease HslVU (ClpYQ) peptidase subunit